MPAMVTNAGKAAAVGAHVSMSPRASTKPVLEPTAVGKRLERRRERREAQRYVLMLAHERMSRVLPDENVILEQLGLMVALHEMRKHEQRYNNLLLDRVFYGSSPSEQKKLLGFNLDSSDDVLSIQLALKIDFFIERY